MATSGRKIFRLYNAGPAKFVPVPHADTMEKLLQARAAKAQTQFHFCCP
jgi:hypothetical protein